MEEKICYKLYCFYSTSSPFGLFHIEDSKSAKDMLMFKDNYIYISMTLALYLALSSISWNESEVKYGRYIFTMSISSQSY